MGAVTPGFHLRESSGIRRGAGPAWEPDGGAGQTVGLRRFVWKALLRVELACYELQNRYPLPGTVEGIVGVGGSGGGSEELCRLLGELKT